MNAATDPDRSLERILESRANFLAFLRPRLPSSDVAEDVLQTAILRSVEKSRDIRDPERVVAWFFRLLRNAVADYYRASGRNPQELSGALVDLESHGAASPETAREVCQCVYPLLDNLKPEYRQALTVIDLDEGRLADLASRAGISEGNAAVRVHRARRAMKKQVELVCGACAEHHCVDCHCKHG